MKIEGRREIVDSLIDFMGRNNAEAIMPLVFRNKTSEVHLCSVAELPALFHKWSDGMVAGATVFYCHDREDMKQCRKVFQTHFTGALERDERDFASIASQWTFHFILGSRGLPSSMVRGVNLVRLVVVACP